MLKKQTKQILSYRVRGIRIAIVRSTYHDDLTAHMEKAARCALREAGVSKSNVVTFTAPGSWEIPVIAQAVARSGAYGAIIALGVIVKGETYHFEIIADNVGRALMDIATRYGIPLGFEVLAVYDIEQARVRSSGEYNKGREAAVAVLKTLGAVQLAKS